MPSTSPLTNEYGTPCHGPLRRTRSNAVRFTFGTVEARNPREGVDTRRLVLRSPPARNQRAGEAIPLSAFTRYGFAGNAPATELLVLFEAC